MQEAVVQFEHISMQFPGVLANDDVTLEVRRGEVFALVGENGAGKSTLMNVLYGIHTPTGGSLTIKGKQIQHFSPKNAIDLGVGMVHQHFMLVPAFTVAENIVLSREPRRGGLLYDKKAARKRAEELSQEYGLKVDPDAVVREIGVGLQQRVEILKTLYRGADVLILDEPTAVLTPQETEELFDILRRMVREKGMTVILITHKLGEVVSVSDRVGVMRQGRLVSLEETRNVTERSLAAKMVGRNVLHDPFVKEPHDGQVQVRVEKLSVKDNRGLPAVRELSLEVHAGEVVGIAAVEGNGQSELIEAVTGMRPMTGGDVEICGTSIHGKTPGQIRKLGLAHIPEDRLATGVNPQGTISENLIMGKHRTFTRLGFHVNKAAVERYAKKIFDCFDVRAAGLGTKVGSLSGGNVQKVVIAREFSFETPVLVISQPTRGVDIGAIEFIHRHIMDKRAQGCAILLCSADLDEVFRLSDRIVTMYEGRITGSFSPEKITKEELGYYMTGARSEEGIDHG